MATSTDKQRRQNLLSWVFWNAPQQRVRAMWRLLGFGLLFVVGTLILGTLFGLAAVLAAGGQVDLAATPFLLAGAAAALLACLASVWLAGRFLDRRSFADFGFHLGPAWWRDLAFGLALGALLMTGIFLAERAAGWVTIVGAFQTSTSGQPFGLAILSPLLLYLCVGIYEELIARGYLLRNLAEGLHLPALGPHRALLLAWALSSALFGLGHAGNPNATLVSTLSLMLAGLFLGLGYLLTGELAIPIGLHITWTFFQGNVFGFPVSGTSVRQATFLAIEQGGPELWTGGAFGPEAGLIGILALLAGSLLIVLWVRRSRGHAALRAELARYAGAGSNRSGEPRELAV
jgi:membrane protease YdiL (CAAX protease family)